jgi:hypothetical protein
VAALLAVFPLRAAWTASQAGEVLALSGQCFLEAGGQRAALKLGDAVHVGDKVEVPEGARLKLRMSDGSVLSAASGTSMTISGYDVDQAAQRRDARLSLASGLLRAVVSSFGGTSHFEVDTATGVAAVRSTDWFVEAFPDSTQIGVLSGVVSLSSIATQRSVDIPARWGGRIEAGRAPVPPRVWTHAEFDSVIDRTNVN